jgi:NADP-dependent 3-hydroxy acid dehydrogenase YdfG
MWQFFKEKRDMSNTGKLQGKVALITGASSGIGEATALALVAEGAQVATVARRQEQLDDLAKRIKAQGGQAFPIVADVADEAQVRNMVQTANSKCGRLDILVNDAGVAMPGSIDGADAEDWRSMVNINLLGLMYATHSVLPIMKAQKQGHIVNVSSVAGRIALAGNAVYSATKWGVCAFSEALRQEVYKDNIRVTIIEPGLVATEISNNISDPTVRQEFQQRQRSLEPLQSEDIAAAIVYAVTQAPHVNVNEILIRPTQQEH